MSTREHADEKLDQPTETERANLLEALGKQRGFLRFAVRHLTDEQAAMRPTASQLCLGGLIKHVAAVEENWAHFMQGGPRATGPIDEKAMEAHASTFSMGESDTLEQLLDHYEAAAQRTDEVVRSLPSLDISHPLPEAPWFPPGARWTARRTVLHLLAETAQHAGHADIIREAIDGQKTMG
jgi:uncharacterized damage-inducible protein DinB